jgi:superfamily II DNA or RNA helicase
MEILISNRIYFKTAGIPQKTISKIKEAFRYSNPQYFRLRAMGKFSGNVPRIIATFKLEENGTALSIPRGGKDKLLNILGDIEYEIVDKQRKTKKVDFELDQSFELRNYQQEAVQKILENKTCLIEAGAGAGKTEMALAAASIGQVTGILVHKKILFEQWVGRINKRLGIPISKIGKVGGGKFQVGEKITVLMQQTARNYIDKLKNIFGAIFVDEVQFYGAKTFLEVVDSFDAIYRVGMSARITRQDLKQFLIHDMFGPVVFKIGREDLVELGYTSPVELHIVKTNFDYDYGNERALRKRFENSFIDFDELSAKEKLAYQEKFDMPRKAYPEYVDAASKDKQRNTLIYKWVIEEYQKGSRIIIFTKRRNHCEVWKKVLKTHGIECAIFWGTNRKKSEEKRIASDLKKMREGKIRIAIGTTLDEGIDLPIVNAGFITYRNAKNPGQLEQQAGRFARLFKDKKSRLYYFHDWKIKQTSGDLAALKRNFTEVVVHAKEKKKFKIIGKKSRTIKQKEPTG